MNIVKKLAAAKGLSQKQLALEIGVSQPTVSDWINNKKDPTGDRLEKLSEFFGVPGRVILCKDQIAAQFVSDLHRMSWEVPNGGINTGYQYAPDTVRITGQFGQGKTKLAAESAQAFQQLDPDRTRYAEQLRAREHFGPTYQPPEPITVAATGPDGVTQQLMHEAVHYVGRQPVKPAEEAEQIRQALLAKLMGLSGDNLTKLSQYADLLQKQEDMEKEAQK